jgi:hypothetical protein
MHDGCCRPHALGGEVLQDLLQRIAGHLQLTDVTGCERSKTTAEQAAANGSVSNALSAKDMQQARRLMGIHPTGTPVR